eukprot:10189-Eustigmatos_ZCMA.PRE.1
MGSSSGKGSRCDDERGPRQCAACESSPRQCEEVNVELHAKNKWCDRCVSSLSHKDFNFLTSEIVNGLQTCTPVRVYSY